MNEVNKYLSDSAKGTWSKPGAIGTRTFNQGGNVDLSTVREGAWKAVHKKTGREVFILVEVESIFGYRELLQEAISNVLGEGISNIYDNCSPEKLSEMYLKCLGFTILDNDGNSVSVFVDAAKLFLSKDGLMSRAFDLIYNSLFGSFGFPKNAKPAKDPAEETLKLEKK